MSKGRVGRLRASMFLRRGGSWTSRDVDAATCGEVRRATSVVVAMAYELGLGQDAKEGTEPGSASEPPPEPTAEPPLEPSASAPSAPLSPSEPTAIPARVAADGSTNAERDATAFVASMAPALDVGTLPSVSVGGWLRAGIERARWSVALSGLLLPGASQTVEGRAEGATIGAAAAGLRACLRIPLARARGIEAGPCAGASYGRYWAHGFGMTDARSESADYLAIDGAFEGAVVMTHAVRLRASVETAFHANRPTFFVGGAGDVHRPAVFALRLGIGPEVSF